MKLTIDGQVTPVAPGQTLLDAIQGLGLVTDQLSTQPLAAKIAGEVFTLNYIPVREEKAQTERPSMRRAMAASGGVVHLLRYGDPTGKDAYVRTAQFVLFLALWQLWPQARAKMNCTLGAGVYIEVSGAEDFSAEKLKARVAHLVQADIPLIRRRMKTEEAIRYFSNRGQTDKARLLRWRESETFDVYSYEDFSDYYYGELAPSTGYLQVWDILPAEGGFIFVFPDDQNPDRVADYREMPKFFGVFTEGEHWGQLMK